MEANRRESPPHVVILGAGTGGTIVANRLRRRFPPGEMAITVVDKDDRHIYQPGLLFVPFGLHRPEDLVRSRSRQLRDGIELVEAPIHHVDLEAEQVHVEGAAPLSWDVLIVASGVELLPEQTEGLTGPGWRERVFDFYTLAGASALHDALEEFDGGRLVVNVVDLPIKCPVAPLEFLFLADWYFTERGIRDRVELVYATPLDAAFTKPVAAKALAGLLDEKNITVETEFNTGEVDGTAGKLVSYDERSIDFDLLVVVPLHGGAAYIERSPGLGDDFNFVPTDLHTLQSKVKDSVFAIGDAANLPNSKAGSTSHFEAEVLVDNVARYLDGKPLEGTYDGHVNCFIETGFHKALLIDFNYETQPLPGKFPFAHMGPMPLLKESRINHLGKLAFEWLYWHALLPGRSIPGITTTMSMRGKDASVQDEVQS
ncbi:MAG TPA: NAD(P)/FAD-dependent oxidoreductase [Polyangiaceae bacterium]|nr:NAD(P)/FAD-dependent oxidoreductase [Polyangiaceae bacterium]